MHEPTYQQAIFKSWRLVWHHKSLWILGLLAVLLGQFGLGDFFGRVWLILNKGIISTNLFGLTKTAYFWPVMSWQAICGLVWLVSIIIILLTGLICLVVIAQGALIYYLAACFKSDSYSDLTKAWHKSVAHFWSILWVNVLYKLIFIILLISSGILLKLLSNGGSLFIGVLLSVSLAVILFFYLIASIVYIYTLGYVVIDNKKARVAMNKAWQLFSRHVLVSFEAGMVLMFCNLVLVVFLVTSLLLAFLPSVIVWLVAGLFNTLGLAIFGLFLGLFLWVLIALLSAAIFNAFNTGVWIYLFMKMHKEGVASRIVEWLKRLLVKS